MLVIALTHATTRGRDEVHEGQFRALGEAGTKEVAQAVDRIRSVMGDVARGLAEGSDFITSVITSPAARCIDTAVKAADALRQYTKVSDVTISKDLAEGKGAQLTIDDLRASLRDVEEGVVLMCAHGDLGAALPDRQKWKSLLREDNFFRSRPAIVIFEYDGGSGDGIDVKLCEMLEGGVWKRPSP
jgi:phosphohistidine phosphatase SixA